MPTYISDLANTWMALGLSRRATEFEGFNNSQAAGVAARLNLLAISLAGSAYLNDEENYRFISLAKLRVNGVAPGQHGRYASRRQRQYQISV